MSKYRLGKTLKPSPDYRKEARARKYVFIPVTREIRDELNKLKSYKSTYSTVINLLLGIMHESRIQDYAAQNQDQVKDENG